MTNPQEHQQEPQPGLAAVGKGTSSGSDQSTSGSASETSGSSQPGWKLGDAPPSRRTTPTHPTPASSEGWCHQCQCTNPDHRKPLTFWKMAWAVGFGVTVCALVIIGIPLLMIGGALWDSIN